MAKRDPQPRIVAILNSNDDLVRLIREVRSTRSSAQSTPKNPRVDYMRCAHDAGIAPVNDDSYRSVMLRM